MSCFSVFPTDPFTTLELENPLIDGFYVGQISRSMAEKLWKVDFLLGFVKSLQEDILHCSEKKVINYTIMLGSTHKNPGVGELFCYFVLNLKNR